MLSRGKAPFRRGCWWVVGVCCLEPRGLFKSRLLPFSSVALGRASEPLNSELSCSAVRQLWLQQARCTYAGQLVSKGPVLGVCQICGPCCFHLGGVKFAL